VSGLEAVRLYSVAKVAEILETGDDFVYARVKDGTLRVVQLGTGRSKYRVRADDLQTFIDERTSAADGPGTGAPATS
jgi:excisionase family DNA binding protein